MRIFKVSGAAMKALRAADARLPPDAKRALEAAPSQPRGRGTSYEVKATEAAAEAIRERSARVGAELVATEVDEALRATGRALLVVASNVERAPILREVGENDCPCGDPMSEQGAYPDVCDQWPLCETCRCEAHSYGACVCGLSLDQWKVAHPDRPYR